MVGKTATTVTGVSIISSALAPTSVGAGGKVAMSMSNFANSSTGQAYGVYFNSMATSMSPVPMSPADSLTTAMDASAVYYQGSAWRYAAQRGLSYPGKSRIFSGLMKSAELCGRVSLIYTAGQLISAEYEALKAEWEYLNGRK